MNTENTMHKSQDDAKPEHPAVLITKKITSNPRVKLLVIANWLGDMEEDLSENLKSPEDAIKLYEYWQENSGELPEYADELDFDQKRMAAHRIAALGYDPLG